MSFYQMLKKTLKNWSDGESSLYGSSIGYYTIFSVGPLVTILIWILGMFFEKEAISGQIFDLLSNMVNANVAEVVQNLVINAGEESQRGMWATILSLVITFFSAMRIVVLLKEALDKMWNIPQEKKPSALVKKYMVGLAGIFGIGVILLVSGLLNAIVFILGNTVLNLLPFTKAMLNLANDLVVFISVSFFISAMFMYLPNLRLHWKAVVPGAIFTSVVFFVGKVLFGWYMRTQMLDSTFGASASLVLFMMWVYFSSQVIFLGAEFTHVYAAEKNLIMRKPKPLEKS